jgi:hypothetical protein
MREFGLAGTIAAGIYKSARVANGVTPNKNESLLFIGITNKQGMFNVNGTKQ